MIICHCRIITDRDVHRAAASGTSIRRLFCGKAHGSCCGSCGSTIRTIMSETSSTETVPGSENS